MRGNKTLITVALNPTVFASLSSTGQLAPAACFAVTHAAGPGCKTETCTVIIVVL